MWSQGPGNETWRIWHLRWTLRCGEGPDRWKRFEKVVQGEGPTGAKAQRLEKYEFFLLCLRRSMCAGQRRKEVWEGEGPLYQLQVQGGPSLFQVLTREWLHQVYPSLPGRRLWLYKEWGWRGLLWGALPTMPYTTIPARSCPQGPQLWWACPLEDAQWTVDERMSK